jgi:DNA (cytosine-5)-methyltransferase 1
LKGLVLSLFPGADLLGKAFENAGFCVVRGPEIILGQDIRDWCSMPGKFDLVIGGSPCQSHSQAVISAGGAKAAKHQDLVPEFARIVHESGSGVAWVHENVKGSPSPEEYGIEVVYDELLDAHWFGAKQHRVRRITSNLPLKPVLVPARQRHPDPWPTITATEHKVSAGSSWRTMRQRAGRKVGRKMTIDEVNDAMGLPEGFETPGLLQSTKYEVRGNGVPMPLGDAIADAVVRSMRGW